MVESVEASKILVSGSGEELIEGVDENVLFSEEIKVEAKKFSCQKLREGFVFKELHRKWERETLISTEQMVWMMKILGSKGKEFGKIKEISPEIFRLGMATAKEKENYWGTYLLFQFSKGCFLIFPAGHDGAEWVKVSSWISDQIRRSSDVSSKGCMEGSNSSQAASQVIQNETSLLDVKLVDLNSRLEKVLEELRYFRCTVEEICSDEQEAQKEQGPVMSFEEESVLQYSLWREVGISSIGSSLSWEEQCGCSGKSFRSQVKAPESDNTPSIVEYIGEDRPDVISGPGAVEMAGEIVTTGVRLGTEKLNDGGPAISFEFELQGFPACRPLKTNLGFPITNPIVSGPDKENEKRGGAIDTVLRPKTRKQRSWGPKLIYPHVSRREAFDMLCRGSIFDQAAVVTLKEELAEIGSAVEQEEELDDWTMFLEEGFQCKSGCLRPAWERFDNREIIGALEDENSDFSEEEIGEGKSNWWT